MTKRRGTGPLEAEDHPRAKLTRARVAEMRQRARAGATVDALAAEAGVAWSVAYRAITGASWAAVDEIEPPVAVRRRRWTATELARLAGLDDAPAPAVARQLGRTPAAVNLQRSRRGL